MPLILVTCEKATLNWNCLPIIIIVYQPFCHILLVLGFNMFESSLKLSLHIPKWFKVIQVLKLFSFYRRVTFFACATKHDVWQAIKL